MIKYFKESFKRKVARRKFQTYGHTITDYNFPGVGEFQYANWDNPLSMGKVITNDQYEYYKQFVKEGDLAVDIGANIGDTTVPMALVAGSKGMVLGFECNPVIFEILAVNEKLNPKLSNIKAQPYAISEKEGEFFYNSSEASLSNGGISSTEKNLHGKFGLETKVKSVNLERFLEKEYPDWINKLSFIKTDTEGHDLVILKSLRSLIEKTRPVIESECFKRASRPERKGFFDMFSELDYKMFLVDTFSGKENSTQMNLSDFYSLEHFDFLAIPS